jgi:hypothetical protein
MPERVPVPVDEQAKRTGETRSGWRAHAALDPVGHNRVA